MPAMASHGNSTMFSSLLRRPKRASRRVDTRQHHVAGRTSVGPGYTGVVDDEDDQDTNDEDLVEFDEEAGGDHDQDEDEVGDDGEGDGDGDGDEDGDGDRDGDEDGHGRADGGTRRQVLPVLPLFSAAHLDTLPIYHVTHSIRIIVSNRTETTLSWDQLRSPQISQFLVKPMQQLIRTQHFSRATLYALMANCLQFGKEGQRYAANAGISNTRAQVCELLALKLLKEYSTRELIDALAYEFYPLQGVPGAQPQLAPNKATAKTKQAMTALRTSTLEVAIRASAKHFLAHPVVVQKLEAIWNGAITFYSSADTLHRASPTRSATSLNGHGGKPDASTPLLGAPTSRPSPSQVPAGSRTVMLYDPRQASMFKLSRLRVPRYRSFLSTMSLAVLIALFLAVLSQRSVQITGLELVFWFWSAGFMLDELVGFNEQGFALYIMSFWNIFDLGILVLLIAYYCMRAYGVFLADPHHWNAMAYDVLAANAILLLPRIFSVLDHYQYFSQLLIAFRLMTADLAAVLILVLIVCSGFFVFFTLSQNALDGGEVAYKIFQILMGFTPAAWDVWPTYNWLARILMMVFLTICHFLVVTILISVLSNSFMAIASNATEEHQFLFAINTISMVKNDALFSYVAPSNIFAWLLMPLRYCMPLKHFVWLNRTIIKVTHFPVLFVIYLYERFWLAPSMFEPTDLVENQGRSRSRVISFRDTTQRTAMFSPNVRVREESVAGFHKDRALEEVFRRVPEAATLRTQRRNERRKTQTAIRNWMDQHDEEGLPSSNWPTVDSRPPMPDWQRRMSVGWERPSTVRQISDVRSTASDPADFMSNPGVSFSFTQTQAARQASKVDLMAPEYKDQTDADADGDDELVTNDEEDDDVTNVGINQQFERHGVGDGGEDYFTTPMAARPGRMAPSSHGSAARGGGATAAPTPRQGPSGRDTRSRTLSTSTILFNPEDSRAESSPSSALHSKAKATAPPRRSNNLGGGGGGGGSSRNTGGSTSPLPGGRRDSPRRAAPYPSTTKPRPILAPRGKTEGGAVTESAMRSLAPRDRLRVARRLSSLDLSMMSEQLGMDDNNVPLVGSFQTQMAMALMKDNRMRVSGGEAADRDRMGRLVLARMKTLEEGFADVVREMRDLKTLSTGPHSRRSSSEEEPRSGRRTSSELERPKKGTKGSMTPRKGNWKKAASRRGGAAQEGPAGGVPGKREAKGKAKEEVKSLRDDEAAEAADGDQVVEKGSSI